jgi:hypothetical protein
MSERQNATRFVISPFSLSKSFHDKMILLHGGTKQMVILNRTSARLWQLLFAGPTRVEIEEAMRQEFAVPASVLSSEIDSVLTQLMQQDFIRMS